MKTTEQIAVEQVKEALSAAIGPALAEIAVHGPKPTTPEQEKEIEAYYNGISTARNR